MEESLAKDLVEQRNSFIKLLTESRLLAVDHKQECVYKADGLEAPYHALNMLSIPTLSVT